MSEYRGYSESPAEDERRDALEEIRWENESQDEYTMSFSEERPRGKYKIKAFKPSKYDPNKYVNILDRIKK